MDIDTQVSLAADRARDRDVDLYFGDLAETVSRFEEEHGTATDRFFSETEEFSDRFYDYIGQIVGMDLDALREELNHVRNCELAITERGAAMENLIDAHADLGRYFYGALLAVMKAEGEI